MKDLNSQPKSLTLCSWLVQRCPLTWSHSPGWYLEGCWDLRWSGPGCASWPPLSGSRTALAPRRTFARGPRWKTQSRIHWKAYGQQLEENTAMRTTTTLSAGGWWWTENRAPMMMSPGICANTLLSLFWALTPAWCLRPSRSGSATRKMFSARRLTQSPGVKPILLTVLLLLTPPRRLCPLKVEGYVTGLGLTWRFN